MERSLGWKIRLARAETGLTQQELGKKLKTSHSVIATWESGKFMPNQESLKKLAEALNKPIPYFFEYEEDASGNTKSLHLVKDSPRTAVDANTMKMAVLAALPDTLPFFTNDDVAGFMEVPRFMFPGAKCVVRSASDNMKPQIVKGDYCIIRPESVFIDDRIMLVRIGMSYDFYKVSKGKAVELRSSDPSEPPPPLKEYKVIGEVVGIIKKLI